MANLTRRIYYGGTVSITVKDPALGALTVDALPAPHFTLGTTVYAATIHQVNAYTVRLDAPVVGLALGTHSGGTFSFSIAGQAQTVTVDVIVLDLSGQTDLVEIEVGTPVVDLEKNTVALVSTSTQPIYIPVGAADPATGASVDASDLGDVSVFLLLDGVHPTPDQGLAAAWLARTDTGGDKDIAVVLVGPDGETTLVANQVYSVYIQIGLQILKAGGKINAQ